MKNKNNPVEGEEKDGDCCGGGCSCDGDENAGHEWLFPQPPKTPCSTKFVSLAAGILFLMMALFVGMQIWGNPWFKNIKAEITSQPYARTITVDGEGKITVKPDIAKVSLSVVSTGKTVKAVTEDGNKKMNAIVAEMKNLGIKSEDIQTSEYNLYPQYSDKPWVSTQRAPLITGYNLNQSVTVKIRDLTKADDVLDKAVVAGANQVGSLSFDLDDSSKIKSEAREKAFQIAKQKAEAMAKAAGVKIGRVVTFSEGFNYPVPMANFAYKAMDSMAVRNESAASVEVGSKEMTVTVSVTYEIE